jgi:hypothetical protein
MMPAFKQISDSERNDGCFSNKDDKKTGAATIKSKGFGRSTQRTG